MGYPAAPAYAVASSSSAVPTSIVTPPQLNLPSILPASVAEQIRRAQVKAAILGQADAAWAIGAKCQAVYSADGQFYNATVEAVTLVRHVVVSSPVGIAVCPYAWTHRLHGPPTRTQGGKFVVAFEGYTDKEEVSPPS